MLALNDKIDTTHLFPKTGKASAKGKKYLYSTVSWSGVFLCDFSPPTVQRNAVSVTGVNACLSLLVRTIDYTPVRVNPTSSPVTPCKSISGQTERIIDASELVP